MTTSIAARDPGFGAAGTDRSPVEDRAPNGDAEVAEVRVAAARDERRGRDGEFEAFVAEARPALSRMAWLLTGDVHRAEELVQQALVRTYVAWPRARATDPLAYARRVLANARIDTWRQRRREVLVGSSDELPPLASPSGAAEHADRDVLVRALARLSPQRRRVVVLRYLLDLPERAVAAELGLSLGAVKSAASRGLDQLRDVLGADSTTKEP